MFVKRNHCKSELIVGNTYLIMGNDGSTRDSDGRYVAIHETSVLPESTVKKMDQGHCYFLFLSQHEVPVGFKDMGRAEANRLSMLSVSQKGIL